ncbi:Tetratricopeptide repeat-containing protein [Flavobacterium fluvii]|uniref:Tetratricopeptide repeat-containing protein n=1 Tax=Flavobacterium fluvii TaxID=468056 RepID=A0A1M5HXF3_9FLAO|nr:tetratricopeptide repeat protein [Flavobacterium fluvii]SHG20691.1 Tetratricopeptide repeat-containing protein [Flavobacterium fluvii]
MNKQLYSLILFFVFLQNGISQGERGSVSIVTKKEKNGTTRALLVGISNYITEGLKLGYAHKDALLFKDYLKKVELIPDENISTLIDGDALSINILDGLKKIMDQTQSGDIAYIYFAGHGDVVDDLKGKQGFLLAADANNRQEYYGTNGVVSLKFINEVVDNITSKGGKVILILDACHSGFLFQEGSKKNQETLNDNFIKSTKFLSCGPDQVSIESAELEQGYFTYYLILGLMGAADQTEVDGQIKYFELELFLDKNVTGETNQKQTPVVWNQKSTSIFRAINAKDKTVALNSIKKTSVLKKAFAARGINDNSAEVSTPATEMNPIVQDFNALLKKGDYHGTANSAYELFSQARKNQTVDAKTINKMQYTLVKALSTDAQILINDYIGGAEALPSGKTFLDFAKQLEICLDVLDKDAFDRDRFLTSKLFLEAYSIIRNLNFSNYKIAEQKLLEALKLQPRAAYIHNALGLLYNESENYKKSFSHYATAQKLIPSWALPLNNIAVNYTDLFQYENAKEKYFEALKLNGNKSVLYSNIGVVFNLEGKYQKAEEYFKKSLEFNPNNIRSLKELGNLNKMKGNIKQSKEWYAKAIEIDTSGTFRDYGLSDYLEDFSVDRTKAEDLLKRAIKENPHYSNVYSDYADFIKNETSGEENLKVADSLYRVAIQNNPYNEWAYAGRGWLFHQLKNDGQANESFLEGIRINPRKPFAYYYYADFQDRVLAEPKNAEKNYLKAIKKDQYYIPAYEALIKLYNKSKQQDKAVKLLQKLLRTNPNSLDFQNLLGDTYFSADNLDKAISCYKKVIELDATYAKAYGNLAYSLLQKKDFGQAKDYFVLANKYDPYKNKLTQFTDLLLIESRAKIKNNELHQAQLILETAYNVESDIAAGYALNEVYYLENETEKAKIFLEKIIKANEVKFWEVKLFELGIKIASDADDSALGTLYYNKLGTVTTNKTKIDQIVQALYLNQIGKTKESKNLLKNLNPLLLNEENLKLKYSEKTIQKIKTLLQ